LKEIEAYASPRIKEKNMTFRKDWMTEGEVFPIEPSRLEKIVTIAFARQKVISFELIGSGCVNLNIKVELKGANEPYLLRIYLRNKASAFIEKKLGELLKMEVPIPQVFAIGQFQEFLFSIVQFKKGIPLADALSTEKEIKIEPIMKKIGLYLAKIQAHRSPQAGYFDKNLELSGVFASDIMSHSTKVLLENPDIKRQISEKNRKRIESILTRLVHFFPDVKQNHLVHGDLDPSNILVEQRKGKWEISAIIDWENAFSYSPLWDVAHLLRFAHQVDNTYTTSLIQGLKEGGVQLPEGWPITVHLINLTCFLNILNGSPPEFRPLRARDLCEQILLIIDQLE